MKRRCRAFTHDEPSLRGTEGQSRKLIQELPGTGYVLAGGADGVTRLYRMLPGTMDERQRESDPDEDISGAGAESWVGSRRNSTGYRINAGDDQAEGWALVIQRLDRIEQALLILIGDNDDDDNPDADPGSILQQTAFDKAPRRRRPTTHDAFPRRDSEIRAINAANRKRYDA